MKKLQKSHGIPAFSLAEILVIVVIISIVAIGTTSFNFRNVTIKQNLETDVINIISLGETVRNAALIGKGVENPIRIPSSWKIQLSSTGVNTLYSFDDTNYTLHSSWQSSPNMSLSPITCANRDASNTENSTNMEIVYTGQNGSIVSGCSIASANKVIITYGNPQFSEIISYDLLTGVIE